MYSFKITSFNCTGYKSSTEYIKETLLGRFDLILLQETWLMPHELLITDNLHKYYNSISISSVDSGASILRGRPYGGLSMMYHQRWAHCIKPIVYGEKRILGAELTLETCKILVLNVYLPTQCNTNYDDYVRCMGKISSIISESDADAVYVAGDWNASPGTPFYREIIHLCNEHNLFAADVEQLPADTYTHVSEAHNSTSWLDHSLVSENMRESITSTNVIYGGATSNHFPITADLIVQNIPKMEDAVETSSKSIKWDFSNHEKKMNFVNCLDELIRHVDLQFCAREGCESEHCRNSIKTLFANIQSSVREVGEYIFGCRNTKEHVVPGWSAYVGQHHEEARRAFLEWRASGSPREGRVACRMRATRATFKQALRRCRLNEETLRAEALASKLAANQTVQFWKDIKKAIPKSEKISGKIDTAIGAEEVTKLWRDSYNFLFNSVNANETHENLLRRNCDDYGPPVSLDEFHEAARELSSGKAVGEEFHRKY